MAELSIRNLHVAAGDKQILKGLDLEVRSGEVLGLIGPNGTGKTRPGGTYPRPSGGAMSTYVVTATLSRTAVTGVGVP